MRYAALATASHDCSLEGSVRDCGFHTPHQVFQGLTQLIYIGPSGDKNLRGIGGPEDGKGREQQYGDNRRAPCRQGRTGGRRKPLQTAATGHTPQQSFAKGLTLAEIQAAAKSFRRSPNPSGYDSHGFAQFRSQLCGTCVHSWCLGPRSPIVGNRRETPQTPGTSHKPPQSRRKLAKIVDTGRNPSGHSVFVINFPKTARSHPKPQQIAANRRKPQQIAQNARNDINCANCT